MVRRKPIETSSHRDEISGLSRIVLQKTYTSYAVELNQHEYNALGDVARKSIESRLDMLIPSLDLLEFNDVPDEPFIYLRLPADVDNEQMHAAIQEILDDEISKALETVQPSPGMRMR